MKRLILAGAFVALALGCSNQEQKKQEQKAPGGINISAPGMNISVDPSGAKVNGGGINIEAGKGAQVTVPGANIQVGDKGAKIEVK